MALRKVGLGVGDFGKKRSLAPTMTDKNQRSCIFCSFLVLCGLEWAVSATVSAAGPNPVPHINQPLVSLQWKDESRNIVPGGNVAVVNRVLVPLGTHPFILTVSDFKGGVETATTQVTVRDTAPPIVTASLAPVSEVEEDEGIFQVTFSCSDRGDAGPRSAANINGSAVANGQIVKLELEDEKHASEFDDGLLKMKGPAFLLTVTCTDASGNTGTATTRPRFRPKEPNQGDGEFPAVAELTQRVAPWLAQNVVLKRVPRDHNHDVFELETANGKLIIRASHPTSAAMGLNWFLKYYCHRSLSHLGNNTAPLTALPELPHPVRRISKFKYRYFLNYTTLNYSLAFADWQRWEREIDWMALNGVNLALATTGTEAVWQNTLRRVGYTEAEILEFIPGPAYTAWWLLGNLEGWGGPVTQRMIDQRVTLQRRILARMRELGIEPVLQGFYGMVPNSLSHKFPAARIVDQGLWSGFPRPKILLPSDPLFAHLASIYYEETEKLYGSVQFFGGDLFHEGGQTTGLDVAAIARGVQDSMLRTNPKAVWVLQGWQNNPTDELLSGLLRSRILILDLDSQEWEKRKGFNGSPWVWGIINNFGENSGMFGDLRRIAEEPTRASRGPYGGNMTGIGALMEGINNNPVVYDLLFEVAWHSDPIDAPHWAAEYAKYRYGRTTPEVENAWQLLLESAYRSSNYSQSIFCVRPSLQATTQIAYDPAKLEEAAREFLRAQNVLSDNDAYQLDAVDLVRQVLSNRGLVLYHQMVSAYETKDISQFHQAADTLLELMRDEDTLLSTRREFLLGTWLAEAKAISQGEEESILCEKNARTQITYWGPADPATDDLHDYASKEWSGLLRDFYLPRWEMLIRELDARLNGKPAGEINYFVFEKNWTEQRNEYPAAPSGDPVATAVTMISKTQNTFLRSASDFSEAHIKGLIQ